MPSNRNLLWIVLIGAVLVALAYYLSMSHAPAPVVPAATAPVTPAASAPAVAPAPRAEIDDPSPQDVTANDAAQSIKQMENDQQQQMMDKPKLPMDGEWVEGPSGKPEQKPQPKN